MLILAVPSKQAFCNGKILPSSPAFFRFRWNLLLTVLRALVTIRTSTTSLRFHRRFSSLFKSWYFSIFFLFFKTYSMVKWTSNIYYCATLFLLVYNYDVWSVSLNFECIIVMAVQTSGCPE